AGPVEGRQQERRRASSPQAASPRPARQRNSAWTFRYASTGRRRKKHERQPEQIGGKEVDDLQSDRGEQAHIQQAGAPLQQHRRRNRPTEAARQLGGWTRQSIEHQPQQ